jgi:hypothetical protein
MAMSNQRLGNWYFCFSAKHTSLSNKKKTGWLGIRIMFPEWSDMSTGRMLFQLASTLKIQLSMFLRGSVLLNL